MLGTRDAAVPAFMELTFPVGNTDTKQAYKQINNIMSESAEH